MTGIPGKGGEHEEELGAVGRGRVGRAVTPAGPAAWPLFSLQPHSVHSVIIAQSLRLFTALAPSQARHSSREGTVFGRF